MSFPPPIFIAVVVLLLMRLRPASTATFLTSFSYSSFNQNTPNLKYYGNASASSKGLGVIDLTPNPENAKDTIYYDVGRVTYDKPIRLHDRASGSVADFVTNFTFLIDGNSSSGFTGNGLTFVLAPPTDSPLPENSYAMWLGLMNRTTVNQFVAVEIDTAYSGSEYDPTNNTHMGIDINTIASNVTVDWQWDSQRRLNGVAWIEYNSTARVLSARMTNRNLQPPYTNEWSVRLQIDLRTVLPENVSVGFSASAWLSFESHQISSWNFDSKLVIRDAPPPRPNLLPPTLAPDRPHPDGGRSKLVRNIVTPCLVFLAIGAIAIVVFVRMRRSKRKNGEREEHAIIKEHHDRFSGLGGGEEELEKIKEHDYEGGQDQQDIAVIIAAAAGKDPFATGPKRFSYGELSAATKGFDEKEKLGHGGFGEVYRGVLKDHQVVAVKRLSKGSSQGLKEYVAEVRIISRLRHRNLVPLLGWCHEQGERCLVYEYMEGGSLDAHLFAQKTAATAQVQILSWAQRMQIALDVASALRYLHEEWEQCVVHRDIKTSNVLIDSKSHARLGDFGLARLVDHGHDPQTTLVGGTMGYLAPEYFFTGRVSKESDVYSFGVVLLEIACGRSASRPVNVEQGTRLLEWLWGLHGSGALLEGVDKGLGSDYSGAEAECMLIVGLWCTLPDRERRPAITEVIQTLSFQKELPPLPSKMPAMVFDIVTNFSESRDIEDSVGLPPITGSSSSNNSIAVNPTNIRTSTTGSSKESSSLKGYLTTDL